MPEVGSVAPASCSVLDLGGRDLSKDGTQGICSNAESKRNQ
jgi:hypothetical protein